MLSEKRSHLISVEQSSFLAILCNEDILLMRPDPGNGKDMILVMLSSAFGKLSSNRWKEFMNGKHPKIPDCNKNDECFFSNWLLLALSTFKRSLFYVCRQVVDEGIPTMAWQSVGRFVLNGDWVWGGRRFVSRLLYCVTQMTPLCLARGFVVDTR